MEPGQQYRRLCPSPPSCPDLRSSAGSMAESRRGGRKAWGVAPGEWEKLLLKPQGSQGAGRGAGGLLGGSTGLWRRPDSGGPPWLLFQDDTCADCKQVAAILIRMVKESSFKESIQKYLEQECAALPVQTLVPQCQTLVDTYYVLFIASLEVQLVSVAAGPPHASALLFQFGTRDDFPIPLPTCWLCTTFMGKIESAIPKGAIGKAISQLCRILPAAIAGMCQCLMERYTEIIVDMLVAKLGPSLICGMLFMCMNSRRATIPQPRPKGPPAPASDAGGDKGAAPACSRCTWHAVAACPGREGMHESCQRGCPVPVLPPFPSGLPRELSPFAPGFQPCRDHSEKGDNH
uniref:Saposin B-type domain-containing protein n=1 Tax=Varanus komodoensis TaxID=61221 RepID=A0A8D2JDU4_VARKO